MLRVATLASLCARLVIASSPSAAQGGSITPPLAVTHVTVIDVERGAAAPDQTVLLAGGRIVSVGASARLPVPRGAAVLDGRGKFLIPGLWDMHVHLWAPEWQLPLLVAGGVTGVRDMGSDFARTAALRRRIDDGDLAGPRIVTPGPFVNGSRRIPSPDPLVIGVATPEDARRAVDSVVSLGADFVKVLSEVPRDAYFALAARARERHVAFAGHIPWQVRYGEAADSGQRSVEHVYGSTMACVFGGAEVCRRALERLAKLDRADLTTRLLRAGTWQTPTLTQLRRWAHGGDSAFAADPRLALVPDSARRAWAADSSTIPRSAEADSLTKRAYAAEAALVGELARAGVGVLAGTDVSDPYLYPGASLHDELRLLVADAGLSPAAALRAATVGPARYLQAADSLGHIAPGAVADLVLLDANPLLDIGNTRRIAAVVLRGRILQHP